MSRQLLLATIISLGFATTGCFQPPPVQNIKVNSGPGSPDELTTDSGDEADPLDEADVKIDDN